MRLLFCCELYHRSRGGIQEVMRQIAERMVIAGHDVTVATTDLPERDFDSFNGVRIRGFKVSGNQATPALFRTQGFCPRDAVADLHSVEFFDPAAHIAADPDHRARPMSPA